MSYTIALQTGISDASELEILFADLKAQMPDIVPRSAGSTGLAMDPGTAALIVDAAKVIAPALISAVASVWVAYIAAKRPADKPKEEQPARNPSIVIETDTASIRIVLDVADVAGSLARAQLPVALEEITRIRLTE
ncbi:MAG: hypothetical protein OZ934_12470 [Anaerolineae bacterium]|nr:hypothetical protein [Anaerolineae bacterium]